MVHDGMGWSNVVSNQLSGEGEREGSREGEGEGGREGEGEGW